MSKLQDRVREVRHRSLWQILGSYVVASWVAVQVLDSLSTVAGLPLWFARAVFILLLIGFCSLLITGLVQRTWKARRSGTGGSLEPTVLRRVFTWRRALLAGVLSFALLGVFTAAWLAMRALGIGPVGSLIARGVLDERTRIVLADFESPDASLGQVATEAFRVDLSQSPSVQLAEPPFVADVLARMAREPGGRLGFDLARELAEREGIPAVVGGEIHAAGSSFLVSARLVSAASGEVLASRRETASDSSEIIEAIDRLSKGLRERIGESLRSIQRSPPLERVTTASLEALRKYSEGVAASRVGDHEQAAAFYREALALDTAFASAWRALAVHLSNFGEERSRALAAMEKAYAHRDRLTERERWLATATYHQQGTWEPARAMEAYRQLLALDSADYTALNNTAAALTELRDLARSEEYLVRAVAADSTRQIAYTNLVEVRVAQERFEDAASAIEDAERRFGPGVEVAWYAANLAAARGDLVAAEEGVRQLLDDYGESLFVRAVISSDLAVLAATRGRLREAETRGLAAMEANEQRELPAEVLDDVLLQAWIRLLLEEDVEGALERLAIGLARAPLEGLDPLDRPYPELAAFYARAGRLDRAKAMLREYETAVPAGARGKTELDYLRARGEIAVAEGRLAEGIEEFRSSDRGSCVICPLPGLANAWELAGEPDSAAAAYEKFIHTPWIDRYWGDAHHFGILLGPACERLAQLLDERGEPDEAAAYHSRFVELWKDADPALQPRVEAARRRLQAIVSARG